MDLRVLLGEVGVTAEGAPHLVLGQQALPQRLLQHQTGVAEVCDAASELGGEGAPVHLPEAAERSPVACLPKQHVQVTVGVYEACVPPGRRAAGPDGLRPGGQHPGGVAGIVGGGGEAQSRTHVRMPARRG